MVRHLPLAPSATLNKARSRLLALVLGGIPALVVGWLALQEWRPREAPSVRLEDASARLGVLSEYLRANEASVLGVSRGRIGHLMMTREVTRQVFGEPAREFMYDPLTYSRRKPFLNREVRWKEHPEGGHRVVTNSLGLREDEEISREHPWRRILVTGDSHTDGVCSNSDSYTNRLEARLGEHYKSRSFEALNAGVGGYSFYNYLGAFERYLEFGIDTMVVGVYGGNDFYGVVGPALVFAGEERRSWGDYYSKIKGAMKGESNPALSQGFLACAYFKRNPDLIDFATQLSIKIMLELQRQCEAEGIQLIVLYIPPACDAQWSRYAPRLRETAEVLELTREDVAVSSRQARQLLGALEREGVAVVDMSPQFRAAPHRLYWSKDLHINLKAHDLIARRLVPLIEVKKQRE